MLYIFSLFFSLSFLTLLFPLQGTEQKKNNVIFQVSDVSYLDISKESQNISDFISEISKLDQSNHSPLVILKDHITQGFSIVEYDKMIATLKYAEFILERNQGQLHNEQYMQLHEDIQLLQNRILEGEFHIDAQLLESNEHLRSLCCGQSSSSSHHLRTLIVNENLDVLGKTTLRKHLHTKQGAHIDGKLRVCKKATFKKDVCIAGDLVISSFTPAGVIHNDDSGRLFSSLIVDADITPTTISNDKLATVSSADNPNYIVVRDSFGNFATNMITLNGTTTNPTDAATKAYVDSVASSGLIAKVPAVVVSIANETLSGFPTIDGVSFPSGTNRILLTGQANPVENGLWIAQAGAWTRPADFASATTAGEAYVLILAGTVYEASSWLCNTPDAIIDTDPLTFVLFSLAATTNAANVGLGTGLVFRDKTGNTLNFKSLLQGSHVLLTNNANDITIATDGTSTNTINTLVARDGSGNFATNMITLNGTVTNPTDAATKAYVDSLTSPVTGANVGTGTGLIFRDKTGNNINFKTLIQGSHLVITNNANDITLATDGTSANSANTLVARNASGNFSAGRISITDAVLSGNIELVNSTSTIGNIEKNGNSFIHNFGTNNTFVGINAGNFVTSGIGQNSGFGVNALASITTGSNNIAIGYQSGQTLSTGNGNIYINAAAGTTNENSTIRIGTGQTACFIAGIDGIGVSGNGVVVDNNGQLGITLSSKRFKHNIEDMGEASANILNLRPVTFAYNSDRTEEQQFGLIAEEVNQLFPAIVSKDEEGQPYTVRYHMLPILLLNELQKMHAIITQQQLIIEKMQQSYITAQEMNQAIASLRSIMQAHMQ